MYRCPEHIDRQQRLLGARTASMDMGVHSFFKGYTDPNLIPCSSIIPRCRPYRASDPILSRSRSRSHVNSALLCSALHSIVNSPKKTRIQSTTRRSCPRASCPSCRIFPGKKKIQFVSAHVTKPIMSSS